MSLPDLSGEVTLVAGRLLGCRLISTIGNESVTVMLNEVEAYGGTDDPASHAFRGQTPRNGSMFKDAGTLYVYRSYGIHWCANVVVGESGQAQAVLLRGGVIEAGLEVVGRRRGRTNQLTDGPGKLTQGLGITGDHDGLGLVEPPLRLEPGRLPPDWVIEPTPRIGISRAVERPWRFVAQPPS